MTSPIAKIVALFLLSYAVLLRAADTNLTPDQLDFFENHIRPVLADNCYRCHSMTSRKGQAAGSCSTPATACSKAVTPARSSCPATRTQSLLIKAIRYTDNDLQMPPATKSWRP